MEENILREEYYLNKLTQREIGIKYNTTTRKSQRLYVKPLVQRVKK